MVEDRITDGRRIAELLASELDGRSDGPLASVAVVNADPDVEPSDGGGRAYDIVVDGPAAATVFVHPERVRIETAIERSEFGATASDGVSIRLASGAGTVIVVKHGAAVKRAVDVLTTVIRGGG